MSSIPSPNDDDTTNWESAESDSSATVDYGGRRKRKPPADPHQGARQALSTVQQGIEELFEMMLAALAAAPTPLADQMARQIIDIHDKLGRIKIGLLPRS